MESLNHVIIPPLNLLPLRLFQRPSLLLSFLRVPLLPAQCHSRYVFERTVSLYMDHPFLLVLTTCWSSIKNLRFKASYDYATLKDSQPPLSSNFLHILIVAKARCHRDLYVLRAKYTFCGRRSFILIFMAKQFLVDPNNFFVVLAPSQVDS